jgi:CHAT domain-containing protein
VQQRIEVDKALADAYAAVQLLPEARAIYDRVIDMARKLGTVSEEARARVQRARVARQQGDRAGAEADFALARSLFDRDGNAASVVFVDLAMASMVLDGGDATGAERAARALVAQLAPAGKRGWWLEARVLQASAAAAAGDLSAARAGFESTLAEAHDVAQVRFACHHGLASLAWRERQEGSARHHLGQAMAQLDDLRAALPGDIFRSAVAASGEALHDLLVRIAVDSGQPAQAVWQAIERGHARALAHAGDQRGDDGGTASLQRAALQWTRERQREALARGDNARGALLEAQALEQEQALLEAHRRALLEAPPAVTSAPAEAVPAPGVVRAGQAIVVYHRLAERLVACVATAAGVSSFVVDATGLDARLDALRLQLDTLRLPGAAQRHGAVLLQRSRAHLQALHTMLWAPLEAALAGCRRVVVVPHERLHYVPFAALHDGSRWLVDELDISLAPSAGLALRALAGTPRAPRSVLAVGRGAAGLQHVHAEAAEVAAAFAGASTLLLGAQATGAHLRAAAPSADVVHLACHGVFRADNPMFSALELSDGPFTLFDAQQLGWRASLVTLSACETGVSRVAPGNEAIGLVRGFLLAGAAGVVASLWAVDDAATAALMRSFYARLRAGDGAAAALGAAQREMAGAGAHPFHWAAFALHGQG